MNQERSLYNQPIRSLQWMLRTIAQHDGDLDLLVPNGIYEPVTQAAVSKFQRSHGLPVTGVTDRDTWEAIVLAYDDALVMVSAGQALLLDIQQNFPPEPGQYSPYLHLAQGMMHFLAKEYNSVFKPEVTGYMDEITGHSLADFQQLAGLPMTGKLDKPTWRHLTLQYTTAAAKNRTACNKNSPQKA